MKQVTTCKELGITTTSRALVFMPHPDDEAVFISGLLQKLARNQIVTKAITVTRGEASTLRYGLSADADLAQARTKELETAYHLLGINHFEIWDFPDNKLEKQTSYVSKKIKLSITQFDPTHIIVLEPDGIYGHPDHIALTQIVMKNSSKTKIIFTTVSPHFKMPSARKMAKKKSIKPIQPEYKLQLTIKETLVKVKCLKAHRSQFQIGLFHLSSLLYFFLNDMLRHEYFAVRNDKQ